MKMKIVIMVLIFFTVLFVGCKRQAQSFVSMSDTAELVNPTGFPIVDEQITMTLFGSRDPNHSRWSEMFFFKKYAEMTNINLDFMEIPSQGFEERKNLLFAANDLPDIFFRSFINPSQFTMYGVTSKQLIPLNPYLDEWAPNIAKILRENESVRVAVTASDGNIYVLPALNFSMSGRVGLKPWINKDWLAKLGLEIPTTPQEFKQVLIAFRDGDPNGNGLNDEIPLGFQGGIGTIYTMGGSWGLEHQMENTINVVDGKVHFWLKDNAFKEYLMFMNELYTEKLIWQNFYKANNQPELRSHLSNAMFGVMYQPYSDTFLNVEDQYTGFLPLIGPYGDQIWSAVTTGVNSVGAFAISRTCKYPEAALRWVDYFYSEEGSLFYRYGVEGETFYYDANGNPHINANIRNDPGGFMRALGMINLVPGGGGPHLISDNNDGIVASELTKKIAADLMPFIPKIMYSRPPMNEIEQEEFFAIVQDLNKYRDESVAKFIIGEWSFDRWDEYCRTLDRIGLPRLERIYQRAFDASRK